MIRLFLGLPGSGKTTTMAKLVEREAKAGHRFFVVDHTGDWFPTSALWRASKVRPTIVDAIPEGGFPSGGIFVFPGTPAEDVARLAIQHGPAVLVDDEADMVSRKGWDTGPVREFIHRGRHVQNAQGEFVEVHMMAATRRPANLHPDFSLVNEVFLFRSMGDLTRDRLLRDGFINTEDEWTKITMLQPGQFFHWPTGEFFEAL